MGNITVDENALLNYQAQIDAAASQHSTNQNKVNSFQIEQENHNVGMVREQLDLTNEIRRIDALLRGCTLEIDEYGNEKWVQPTDDRMKIFSEYGIQEIRNLIAWYINKNTLLSNFPEIEMINKKMRRFAHALNDLIYMKYEEIFEEPSAQACIDELKKRLKNKEQIKKFVYDSIGRFSTDESIQDELKKEMEGKMEKELENIKNQLLKNKLKKFDMVQREIEDAVHATLLRAYKGEERGSFRRHMNINEHSGFVGGAPTQQPTGIKALFGMGGKR